MSVASANGVAQPTADMTLLVPDLVIAVAGVAGGRPLPTSSAMRLPPEIKIRWSDHFRPYLTGFGLCHQIHVTGLPTTNGN